MLGIVSSVPYLRGAELRAFLEWFAVVTNTFHARTETLTLDNNCVGRGCNCLTDDL